MVAINLNGIAVASVGRNLKEEAAALVVGKVAALVARNLKMGAAALAARNLKMGAARNLKVAALVRNQRVEATFRTREPRRVQTGRTQTARFPQKTTHLMEISARTMISVTRNPIVNLILKVKKTEENRKSLITLILLFEHPDQILILFITFRPKAVL